MSVLVSICIPAYSRTAFLKRLLDSVEMQSFKDYEVIVCDDSPDESVKDLCERYKTIEKLSYHKNLTPLGTPENWNECIRRAKGSWIKLMHDDDWFAGEDALKSFVEAIGKQEKGLLFSAYTNYFDDTGGKKIVFPEKFRIGWIRKTPSVIMAKNIIGPPSVVMHRNDGAYFYDTQLKWLVDIDMYRRRMETDPLVYINQPLINVGISKTQVTAHVKMVPEVEIPEHFHFLQKMGVDKLKNIWVYDYWWRFIRNFRINTVQELERFHPQGQVPLILQRMIRFQNRVPKRVLNAGVFSKMLMFWHYCINRRKI